MRFDRNTSAWGVVALSAALGALIWALSPGISGRVEPWDADSAYYLLALPVAGFMGGLLAGGPLWAQYVGVVGGQFVYGLLFTGAGPLMLLGIAFLAAYALLYLLGNLAGIGARRAFAQDAAPRAHLRLAGGTDGGAWLDRYDGQSMEDLLALRHSHRLESLMLVCADALRAQAVRRPLNDDELRVLAVADFDRDMAAGGFNQFLRNAGDGAHAGIVAALRAIDCPKAADIVQEVFDVIGPDRLRDPIGLGLRMNDLSVRRHLHECDALYVGNDEPLSRQLLAWIEPRAGNIALSGD